MPYFKDGQISIEYLFIIGFATLILTILLGLSLIYSKDVEDEVYATQAERIVKEIVKNAETVYYYGPPSKTTLTVFMPENIEDITIDGKYITFKLYTQHGVTDIFQKAKMDLQGKINKSPGIKEIYIEAREGYVWLNSS